jgi:hypothetical protein
MEDFKNYEPVWMGRERVLRRRQKSRGKPFSKDQVKKMRRELDRIGLIKKMESSQLSNPQRICIKWWLDYLGGTEAFENIE